MTTLDDVAKKKAEQSAEQKAAVELVRLAQQQGLSLTGPDGLLKQLTKTVLETALNEEMTEHLGYEKHDPPESGTGPPGRWCRSAPSWRGCRCGRCIIHLLRNTFWLTYRKYWDEIKRDVKPIYTAVNAAAARVAFEELAEKWGQRYPAVIRLWDNAWNEFIPFLDYVTWRFGG